MAYRLKANSPDAGTSIALFDAGFEVDLVNATVAIKDGVVLITKATAIALTLAPPVAGLPTATVPGDDGKVLRIVSTTAAAHVVTCSDGFNAKGSSGTATFAANIGNACTLVAYNGHWFNVTNTAVTYA